MSTLYIRLASKASTGNAPDGSVLPCRFALASHGGAIEREGAAPLPDLSGTVAKAQRVVLLLAASDVTLLRLHVPPLSPARLKAALPNLVEDQLITDPADCVVVAGDSSGGLSTIAVVERAWLERLVQNLGALGARHVTAFPAQMCLPQAAQTGQSGSVTAAVSDANGDIELTLRMSEQEGIGLAIAQEGDVSATHLAIRTLSALVPEKPVVLYVPQASMGAYQEVVNDTIVPSTRISVSADNWSRWIAGARHATPDLIAGLGEATRPALDWRPWRWPLALASAILVINLAALNIGWWHMKAEARSLYTTMIQIYISAYPKESVIIDPLAQMQRKIALAKHDSGLAAPDDFTTITAALGEAWSGVVQDSAGKPAPAIAGLEYHDRSLFVHLKPVQSGVEGPAGDIPTQQMKMALAKFDLALEPAPAESGMVVWKIRSSK